MIFLTHQAIEQSHVLINIDTQSTHRINFVSILNHNMKSADAKVRVFAGNISSDISSLDTSAADTSDIDWSSCYYNRSCKC